MVLAARVWRWCVRCTACRSSRHTATPRCRTRPCTRTRYSPPSPPIRSTRHSSYYSTTSPGVTHTPTIIHPCTHDQLSSTHISTLTLCADHHYHIHVHARMCRSHRSHHERGIGPRTHRSTVHTRGRQRPRLHVSRCEDVHTGAVQRVVARSAACTGACCHRPNRGQRLPRILYTHANTHTHHHTSSYLHTTHTHTHTAHTAHDACQLIHVCVRMCVGISSDV